MIVIFKFETIFVTLVNHGLICASKVSKDLFSGAVYTENFRGIENYMHGAEPEVVRVTAESRAGHCESRACYRRY